MEPVELATIGPEPIIIHHDKHSITAHAPPNQTMYAKFGPEWKSVWELITRYTTQYSVRLYRFDAPPPLSPE